MLIKFEPQPKLEPQEEIIRIRIMKEIVLYSKEGFGVGEVVLLPKTKQILLRLKLHNGCVRIPETLIENAITKKAELEKISGNLNASEVKGFKWNVKEKQNTYTVKCSVIE